MYIRSRNLTDECVIRQQRRNRNPETISHTQIILCILASTQVDLVVRRHRVLIREEEGRTDLPVAAQGVPGGVATDRRLVLVTTSADLQVTVQAEEGTPAAVLEATEMAATAAVVMAQFVEERLGAVAGTGANLLRPQITSWIRLAAQDPPPTRPVEVATDHPVPCKAA